MTIFGASIASFEPLRVGLMPALKSIGFEIIQLSECGFDWAPEPGRYVWSRSDHDVKQVTDADLTLYLKFTYLPAWMTGGKPIMHKYYDGCAMKDDSAPYGWRPSTPDEKPWCHEPNVPAIDEDAVYDLGFAVGDRYRSVMKYASVVNEGDERTYNPYMTGTQQSGLQKITDMLIAPYVDGLRSAHPGVIIVGPECAYADGLRRMLEDESHIIDKHSDQPETIVRLNDILSEHVYSADGTRDGYIRRASESVAFIESHRRNRQLWLTETDGHNEGGADQWSVEWLRAVVEMGRYDAVFPWGAFYFEKENYLTLNANGLAMKQLIADANKPARRRAVRVR